ncbi:kelch-like protein 12 [Mizuhopecten yessoensis]|uniref:kelch-like protein 12 n=1 Tax=Mizuhopecten yessoensis TaxID=6573 RepID=UPI000B45A7F8|nr:kelch-like protein 12 [Mizuhopecten yessoensis]
MENVAELFIASSYLQVVFVKESCERYLLDNLDKSNCIRTWCLADQYNAMMLNKKAVLMFMMEFENISSTEDFVTMVTMEMFLGVLEQEGLVVSRDGVIFPPAEQEVSLLEGVLHYIDSTKCSTENAVSLLKTVRLPFIEHTMITEHMSKYPRLCQNNAVKKLVDPAKTFQESSEPPQQTSSICVSPRRPKINGYMYDPKTYAVGGKDGIHFFLISHFGLPKPSKEALITSVDVHLRFGSHYPPQGTIVGGLTFRYSDNTVTQGGLAAGFPFCTKVESFTLQDCEYITKVVITSGWMINNIKFETNFGKSYGPWGGEDGKEHICVAPNRYLHSFAGININFDGCSAVHQVRLGWATLDDTEQEL